MPKDSRPTRERIMEVAQRLILERGYSATSVDQLIAGAGITKGTFFYHFPTKHALAETLVRRWAEQDVQHLEENLTRAKKLARDPAQQLLVFVGLFQEMFEQPAEDQPGCLYASFCYEVELTDTDIAAIIKGSFDVWRERLQPLFDAAVKAHRPRVPVASVELVDMLGVIFEGSFILSRVYKDQGMIAAQLRQYRNYLELLFTPA